ncbi:MAG TPA: hypothetical protein VFQ50_05310, partial [Flavobacterium sp.]|nr:hypothetical protein [Flavobacterium sp.]
MKKITLSFLLLLPLWGISQSTCATAQMVTSGMHEVAAVDGTEVPTPSCTDENEGVTAAVWYSFTATTDGLISISSNLADNMGGDTRLHVYSGTCGSLTCIGFNDDVNVDGGNYLSEVVFDATSGTTYYF